MNFRDIPREISRFDDADTSHGAPNGRVDWRTWFMKRCHRFAPKLKRAWCEVAFVDQGLDVADLKLLEDAMDADLTERGESRPLRRLGDDWIERDCDRR